MEMRSSQQIALPQDQVWRALNDIDVLRTCIAGCELLELVEENCYVIVATVAVGPVKARFNGKFSLTDIVPPNSYRITFDAKAAGAGFGTGTAVVELHGGKAITILTYEAKAQIGGKLAQIGSRLVDAAAKKLAAEFFAKFEKELASRNAPVESIDPAEASQTAVVWRLVLVQHPALIAALAIVTILIAGAIWWIRQ